MYEPSILFERTPAERADPLASWARGDQAFFAAGACHILAEAFRLEHPGQGYDTIYLRPLACGRGSHVYVARDGWAFDHSGWTREDELLGATREACARAYPGWDFERVIVREGIEAFCVANNHARPDQFAYLPWDRAKAYLRGFDAHPPHP